MWTHLGAPKLCSQMRASKQALQYPCAPSTCWITSPIAENVQTTNSSRPSTLMMCKLPRQLNRLLTTSASFTLMGCLGAASILTACSKVVTLAAKYFFSEINLQLWFELWCTHLLCIQLQLALLYVLVYWAHTFSVVCMSGLFTFLTIVCRLIVKTYVNMQTYTHATCIQTCMHTCTIASCAHA